MQQERHYENRERIATLETQSSALHEQVSETREDVRAIQRDVREIKVTLTSHRGFVAGVVVSTSILWSFAIGVWQFVKHKFGA